MKMIVIAIFTVLGVASASTSTPKQEVKPKAITHALHINMAEMI